MRVYKSNKIFGKRIQKIRKGLRISQEDLGDRVGIHRNHMGKIERGETNPPIHLIEKIAKILKVKASDLFAF